MAEIGKGLEEKLMQRKKECRRNEFISLMYPIKIVQAIERSMPGLCLYYKENPSTDIQAEIGFKGREEVYLLKIKTLPTKENDAEIQLNKKWNISKEFKKAVKMVNDEYKTRYHRA